MEEVCKPFLSIEEQIQKLRARGLNIDDSMLDKTKDFLLNNNYYRISGYSLTLRKDDKFSPLANINTLIQIYDADQQLRHLILHVLENIEVKLKSMLAYYHSQEYGALGYTNINNFSCVKHGKIDIKSIFEYIHITKKADSQKNIMLKSELYLKHHKENRNDLLPFWVYVEILTISDISKIYSILDKQIKTKIAKKIGITISNGSDILENLLHCVTVLRNICAHGGRLYNRLFTRKPRLSSSDKKLLRNENGEIIFNKLFSYVLVIKQLASCDKYSYFLNSLKQLSQEYPLVSFRHYGFPDNWKEIL